MFCFLLIVNTVFCWNKVCFQLLAYKIFQVLIFVILSARTRTLSLISNLLHNFIFLAAYFFLPYLSSLSDTFFDHSLAEQRFLLDGIWTYTIFFTFKIVHIFSRLFSYSHPWHFGLLFIRYGSYFQYSTLQFSDFLFSSKCLSPVTSSKHCNIELVIKIFYLNLLKFIVYLQPRVPIFSFILDIYIKFFKFFVDLFSRTHQINLRFWRI